MKIKEKKNILRFLKRFSLLLILLLIILEITNFIFSRIMTTHYRPTYKELFTPSVCAETVIFGSSSSVHGINPKYLDRDFNRFFNFSFNGTNPEFYYKWYTHIFRKYYPRPSCIIYAINWYMFDDDWMSRKFEDDAEFWPFKLFISELFNNNNRKRILLTRFPILKYHDRFIKMSFKEPRIVIEKYYHGYVPIIKRPELSFRIVKATDREKQKTFFEKLLKEFKRDSIPVVAIQMPEYLPGRDNKDQNRKFFIDIFSKYNFPYLDYNGDRITEINYDSTAFLDWGHLSEAGAIKFSKMLGNQLQEVLKSYKIRIH